VRGLLKLAGARAAAEKPITSLDVDARNKCGHATTHAVTSPAHPFVLEMQRGQKRRLCNLRHSATSETAVDLEQSTGARSSRAKRDR
jgi:hypothetical protein